MLFINCHFFTESDTCTKEKEQKAIGPKMIFSLCFVVYIQSPSRLLIQVPRFGKQFKTYQKIVPNLSLDVMDLVDFPCKHL